LKFDGLPPQTGALSFFGRSFATYEPADAHVEFPHGGAGIFGQAIARVLMEKALEGGASFFEIVFVDFADGEERVEAV